MGVDITGFERRRREQAEAEAKALQEEQNTAEGEGEALNEELTIDEVKAKLEELGVKFSHNTGEAKLREKLANATQ